MLRKTAIIVRLMLSRRLRNAAIIVRNRLLLGVLKSKLKCAVTAVPNVEQLSIRAPLMSPVVVLWHTSVKRAWIVLKK